jgi:uncharacterized protein
MWEADGMKKRILIALLAILLVALTAMPLTVSANRTLPLVVDNANILSNTDEEQLGRLLERLREELQCEIAIVTTFGTNGKSAQAFADDFYDANGYGYGAGDDGALLLISIGVKEREWAISTHGLGHRALGDDALDGLADRVVPYLAEGHYYRAGQLFAEGCEFYVNYKRNPDSVDENSIWMTYLDGGTSPVILLVIAAGLGIVIAFIVVNSMKAKLTSVRSRDEAREYVRPNSFRLTMSRDIFLYHTVTRVRRDTDRTSGGGGHRSSSGRTHGGRSGSF